MDSVGVVQRSAADVLASEAEQPVAVPFQVLAHYRVLAAMQSLPEQLQATLWHIDVLGHTPGETAPFLGIHDSAVVEALAQAREGLRQAYEQQHPGTARWR